MEIGPAAPMHQNYFCPINECSYDDEDVVVVQVIYRPSMLLQLGTKA